jgi:hypothetical protein
MQTHLATTDDAGVYSATGVLPGDYDVEVTSAAYKTNTLKLAVPGDADVSPGGAADASMAGLALFTTLFCSRHTR